MLLICGLSIVVASPHHGRRLVCWEAILKCTGEPQCHYAYDQYLYACAPVIGGGRNKCPSHCISSLVQLNRTQNGPALEDCDCAQDLVCRRTQQAIEPCLPRTSTLGCTEARHRCEADRECSSAMKDYLFHCRKLFGGNWCSDECRRVIANMRSIAKAQQLETCVCDGTERTICEYVKLSMQTLCSGSAERGFAGSGFGNSDEEEDGEENSGDDSPGVQDWQGTGNSGEATSGHVALTVLTTILAFIRLM